MDMESSLMRATSAILNAPARTEAGPAGVQTVMHQEAIARMAADAHPSAQRLDAGRVLA